jgi:hypothetical protein
MPGAIVPLNEVEGGTPDAMHAISCQTNLVNVCLEKSNFLLFTDLTLLR